MAGASCGASFGSCSRPGRARRISALNLRTPRVPVGKALAAHEKRPEAVRASGRCSSALLVAVRGRPDDYFIT